MKAPARRLGAVLTLSLLAVATPLTAAAQTVPSPGTDPSTGPVAAAAPAAPGPGAVTAAAWAAAAQADTTASSDEVAAEQAVADVAAALEQAVRDAGLARGAAEQAAARVAGTGQAVRLAEGVLRGARTSAAVLRPLSRLLDWDSEIAARDAAVQDAEDALAVARTDQVVVQTTAAATAQQATAAATAAQGLGAQLDQARADLGAADAAHAATSAALAALKAAVDPAQHRLLVPAAGDITSPFGMRVHPVTGVNKLHTGLDLARGDSAIFAAADGVVVSTAYDSAFGNLTKIDHGVVGGARLVTWYAHQSAVDVAPGQQVTAGERIGTIGSTGASTGAHLHFEVRLDDQPTDPAAWLF